MEHNDLEFNYEQLKAEHALLKEKLARIEDGFTEKCAYAGELVWYARQADTNPARRACIETKYAKEVSQLLAKGAWQDGFNAGVLVVTRFVDALTGAEATAQAETALQGEEYTVENAIEYAHDDFGSLNDL